MIDDALSQWLKVNMRGWLGGWKVLQYLDKIKKIPLKIVKINLLPIGIAHKNHPK